MCSEITLETISIYLKKLIEHELNKRPPLNAEIVWYREWMLGQIELLERDIKEYEFSVNKAILEGTLIGYKECLDSFNSYFQDYCKTHNIPKSI